MRCDQYVKKSRTVNVLDGANVNRATPAGKAQGIRLIDVFLLGPWLMYLATRPGRLNGFERGLLLMVGAATVLYNGQNYLRIKGGSP